MTAREMTEAAARALGLRLNWEEVQDCHWIDFNQGIASEPWTPLTNSAQCFALAAALRISVEHNATQENHPWVSASVESTRCSVKGMGSMRCYLEHVPDEPQREDRMRLAILRCAASLAPKEAA